MSCEGGLAHPLRAEGPSLIIVASVAFGFNFESPIMAAIKRERLPNRRLSETFDFEFAGYTCTARWFRDGRIAEIFLSSHKSNSVADTAVTDAAIVASIALQFGANVETIRRALCRDSRGHARAGRSVPHWTNWSGDSDDCSPVDPRPGGAMAWTLRHGSLPRT
jgi:hypothetical protein